MKAAFMLKHLLFLIAAMVGASQLAGCATSSAGGPGMILTYIGLIEGRSISIESAKLPSGVDFAHAGSFGGSRPRAWRSAGKTMGGSGDRRGLPEWVEYVWQEPEYPGLKSADFATPEAFSEAVTEKFRRLPYKTQRVMVRERVPLDVVHEAVESRNNAKPGKVPEKMLWIYFVWTDDGVKMHWSLKGVKPQREGGDDIDAMYR